MADISEPQVLSALKSIKEPGGSDIVTEGMISGLTIKNGHVVITLEIRPDQAQTMEPVRKAAEKAVHDLPGVISAAVVLTAERGPGHARDAHGHDHGHHDHGRGHNHGHNQNHGPGNAAVGGKMDLLPDVRAIIAVASGKGGVGKSTTAVNLALALSGMGLKVGMFDADIYGPSQPRLLGITGQPESLDGQKLEPMQNYGIKCMSMGFLVPEDSPIIWRGPMVMGALEQMMRDVNWGALDVMVIDMPPGTGDTQLTMSQRVPLTGAVIVSTPQDIALLDARKGLNMFRKVEVPVMGIIENMSTYVCPKCGHEEHIFGHGGAKREAMKLNCDFLGEIPLDIAIRETSDGGTPIMVSQPDSPHAKAYQAIARKVWDKASALMVARKMPKISMQ